MRHTGGVGTCVAGAVTIVGSATATGFSGDGEPVPEGTDTNCSHSELSIVLDAASGRAMCWMLRWESRGRDERRAKELVQARTRVERNKTI